MTAGSELLADLQGRDLVVQTTGEEELVAHLSEQPRTLYCGFDPSADSLHIGSLVPLLALRRFQLAGHRPVALVGGATGLVGDPSFKAAERKLNSAETVAEWTECLRRQNLGSGAPAHHPVADFFDAGYRGRENQAAVGLG